MTRQTIVGAGMVGFVSVALVAQTPTSAPQTATRGTGPQVTLIRSCEIAEGRDEEAMKWVADIVVAARTEGKPPFETARSYREMFGDLGRVHFIVEFANLNAAAGMMDGRPPQKMQALAKQGATLVKNCKDMLLRELGQQQQ